MRMRDEKKHSNGDLAGSQPNSEPSTPKSPKSNSDTSSLSVGSVGSEASKKKAALLHSISQRRLIFDDPTMRDTEEMMYFWRTCSKILDYLYIGSEEAAKNKRMLKENLGMILLWTRLVLVRVFARGVRCDGTNVAQILRTWLMPARRRPCTRMILECWMCRRRMRTIQQLCFGLTVL